VASFLEDFLTPTEKMMLAKRLAVAVMLAKGYDYRAIRKTLKVSFHMVANVNLWLKYKGKGYQKVINWILREEKIEKFWQKVDDVLGDIVPPQGPKLVLLAKRKMGKEDGKSKTLLNLIDRRSLLT